MNTPNGSDNDELLKKLLKLEKADYYILTYIVNNFKNNQWVTRKMIQQSTPYKMSAINSSTNKLDRLKLLAINHERVPSPIGYKPTERGKKM